MLKYLAPYLPYDLIIQCDFYNFYGSHVTDKVVLKIKWYGLIMRGDSKPILRPLSRVKEVIETEAGEISPLIWLAKKLHAREGESFDTFESCLAWVDTCILQEVLKPKGYDKIPHWAFQDLIKWHFDVFGLIDKGQAVEHEEVKS